jgi:hypothetical protein
VCADVKVDDLIAPNMAGDGSIADRQARLGRAVDHCSCERVGKIVEDSATPAGHDSI